MEEKIKLAREFIEGGHPQDTVLRHLMIPRSTYYYKPPQDIKSKGRPVSSHTMKKDQTWATNEEVISDIKEILSEEFVDYGYLKTTHAHQTTVWVYYKSKESISADGREQIT
ncbi:MAG: hypothetical protein IPL55_22885 [Saprospiraceae bacterium]|nr:hypothetical protein [Saprospiraceae bacterium]